MKLTKIAEGYVVQVLPMLRQHLVSMKETMSGSVNPV